MDGVRKAFATANNADAGLFSFNSKGACPNCQGLGVTYTDLGFLEGVKLPCEVRGGRRFKDEALASEQERMCSVIIKLMALRVASAGAPVVW